jgi:hypothetical protein
MYILYLYIQLDHRLQVFYLLFLFLLHLLFIEIQFVYAQTVENEIIENTLETVENANSGISEIITNFGNIYENFLYIV